MTRARRLGCIAVVALVAIPVVLVLLAQLPVVQRWAWTRVTESLEASTGWQLRAGEVRLRLWPARLAVGDLSADAGAGEVLHVDRLTATWSWRGVVGRPIRIESVQLSGVGADLRALPPSDGREEPSRAPDLGDVLGTAELGRLELDGGRVGFAAGQVGVVLSEVRMTGALDRGRLRATVAAGRLTARREDRELEAGPLELRLHASAEGAVIDEIGVADGPVRAQIEGRVGPGPALEADLHGWVEAELPGVLGWWDPAARSELRPRGALRLEGRVGLGDSGVSARLVQTGPAFDLAGYSVDHVEADVEPDEIVVGARGEGWGRAEVRVVDGRRLSVKSNLRRAPVAPVLRWIGPIGGVEVPREAVLSGDVDAAMDLPLSPATMKGRFDLAAAWREGSLAARGRADAERVRVDEMRVQVPGASAHGRVTVTAAREVDGRVEARVEDAAAAADAVRRFVPSLPEVPARLGGTLVGEASLSGPMSDPRVDAEVEWQQPAPDVQALQSLRLTAEGSLSQVSWELDVKGREEVRLVATGTARPVDQDIAGEWTLEETTVDALRALVPAGSDVDVAGSVAGHGTFEWGGDRRSATVAVEGRDLEVGTLRADRVDLEIAADDAELRLRRLEVETLGATLSGSGSLGFARTPRTVALQLRLEGLEPRRIPGLPEEAPEGVFDADLGVSGSLDRPEAELRLHWSPAHDESLLRGFEVVAGLEDGVVSAVTEKLDTSVASAGVQAQLPLGDVPRPWWLWPDAPGGPLRASARVERLDSEPILALLGIGAVPARLTTALDADFRWSFTDPADRQAEIALPGLEIRTVTERLQPRSVPAIRILGNRVILAPVSLSGQLSEVRASGTVDLSDGGRVNASATMTLAPGLVRSLPLPIDSTGPVHVEASASGPLDGVEAHAVLDVDEGALVMRDPPVEVSKLHLEVAYHDGYLEVLDGSAEVNRGHVLVAGEWNPETGQGLIFGLEHVTFLLEGILTRWSGDVVFEPARGRLGRVVGDLVLEKGLWDQPVDFASMVLGEGPQADVVDEALYDVVLDLEVRGRGGVHVDNNLGEFDVTWNTLAVGGTAAEPSLEGEMHIAAGGVLTLSGRPIEIRQGTVRFTGIPGAEPEVEIVPQNSVSVLGAGGGGGFDAEALARRGIASGLGQSLGLRNTSLAPADIALETGSETTSGFLVARQVGRYIAIFFSADLAEVQNQTALLQLYNWSKLPGLAVQVFDEAERGNGYAVFERYRWGGTRQEDEQRIRNVTLEGDWPVSKRRLKKAAGLRRGQPWDPFLLFVGRMRLERELAAHGYFRAQVDGRVSEDETLPHVYFSVEPGPRQEIRFEGDSLSKEARREVVMQYRPPPMEEGAFESMRTVAERYLAADEHPEGQVRVSREGEQVVVDVQRGPELELHGPEVAGLPPEVEDSVQRVLGSPVELARMVREPDRALQRVERILSLEGYRQATATSVELDRTEESQATVRVRVEPGLRATIDSIEVLGADPLGLTSGPTFGLEEGDPLRQWAIDAVVRRLRRTYRDAGYLEIEVRAEIEATPRGGWKVVVHLDPGQQKTISEIGISGRRHVSEKVLRNGLEVAEGEVADPSKIDESVLQLASFAPIERVDLDVKDVGRDAVKLDLEVTEKPRWTVGLGARWTSDYGRELLLDLRDDGLLARGVSANLRASKGSDVQVIRLITSLPRGPGGRFSSSVTLELREEPTPTSPNELYDTKRSVVLEGSYLLADDLTVRGYYRYQRTRTRELEPDPFFPIDTVTPVTTLGGQAILDRLDDPLNPTAGFYAAADAGWSSSKLGGELDTIRTLLTGTMALEPRTRWTWQQSLRLGVAQGLRGTDVDPAVRFFAGGQSSIRGFERDLVGPIVVNDQGEARPLGGNALVVLNEELRVPVWGPLRAAVFVDLGQVWPTWSEAGLDLAVGTGVGFRWDTPIGPLWGDIAWPVANKAVSEGPKYYIGIGRPF